MNVHLLLLRPKFNVVISIAVQGDYIQSTGKTEFYDLVHRNDTDF
jgi:hypothetical protein